MYSDVLLEHPAVGRPVCELATPAPVVDVDVLRANIDRMADFFRGRPARLRPHVKTHRAPAIARLQVEAGAGGVTCAKVSMAEAMVAGGVDDIFVANQVVARQAIDRLCRMAQRATVTVAVDDAGNVAALAAAAQQHGVTLRVVIEVDAGMGRCGVQPGEPVLKLATAVERAAGLRFVGLHTYEGHVVQHAEFAHRKTETERMLERTLESRDLLQRHGIDVPVVTCGGTGTYDISGVYPGVTEHQAGSYVYMDPGYQEKVPAFDLAFSIMCTVVSRPSAQKVITDGGLQSLANDYGKTLVDGHPELTHRYLSEEHGSYLVRDGCTTALNIGEVIAVHPGHCCSAANLHDHVFAARDGVVEAVWLVTARGRSE